MMWTYAFLAVLMPILVSTNPLFLTDSDPSLQDLLKYELSLGSYDDERSPNSVYKDDPTPDMEPDLRQPVSDLMRIFGDDDIRLESKRSGLRAALAARMGRGSMIPLASVSGPQSLGSHVFIAPPPPGPPGDGSYVSRRSQAVHAPYLGVGKMSGAKDSKPGELDYKILGVLSNVEQYFKGLQQQLETMADDPEEAPPTVNHLNHHFFGVSRGGPRPAATAAYLHALRSHGPSHRIRSFVEDPGPLELRGANSHDPALLWTGLGRR